MSNETRSRIFFWVAVILLIASIIYLVVEVRRTSDLLQMMAILYLVNKDLTEVKVLASPRKQPAPMAEAEALEEKGWTLITRNQYLAYVRRVARAGKKKAQEGAVIANNRGV